MFRIRCGAPRCLIVAAALYVASGSALSQLPRVLEGLASPESALVGPDGRIYVSEIGEFGKNGDGKVSVIGSSGKAEPFATGLDDPKGLAAWKDALYVADKTRIVRIDKGGKTSVFAAANAFPQAPLFLNDLVFDDTGNLYVSDSGDIGKGGKGAIFRVSPQGQVTLVSSEAQNPALKSPNGLLFEAPGKLLVLDFASGELLRLDTAKGSVEKLAEGFGGGDGLAKDGAGMLYISDWKGGRMWKLDLRRKDAKPQQYAQTLKSAADLGLSSDGNFLLVPDMKAGTLHWIAK